ncbi:MAG: GGDEF domain-containing protein [Clostridia bacterium]|nr:GGDEF domain-containing protein [Clostridia bacterium]
MFNNGRKNIGIFINKIDDYFQKTAYYSLMDKANECNCNLIIFNSYSNRMSVNYFDMLEERILDFAPYEELDGIIVVPDSYSIASTHEYLIKMLKTRCHAPIVSLRSKRDDFYNVLTDENNAIRGIIRHFIEYHKFTRICFMSGYQEHYDAQMRLKCFVEEMEAAGLPLTTNSVYYGDFWYTYGKEAADFFFSNPESVPQAIICANDYMAISLSNALREKNIRIPEDVCISGYDNAVVSREYDPPITTVSIDFASMARRAMDVLLNLMAGKSQEKFTYIEPIYSFRKSCGCLDSCMKEQLSMDTRRIEQSAKLIEKQIYYTYFSVDVEGSSSIEQMHNILAKDIGGISKYNDFYLCLFGQEDYENFIDFTDQCTENSTLRIGFKNKQDLGNLNITFPSKEILPDIATQDKPMIMYVTLLHNQEKCFGYTVASFEKGESYDIFFQSWNVTLSIVINEIYTKIRVNNLIRRIEEQSIMDSLTGLHNRRGFEQMVENNWAEQVHINSSTVFICIDLDRLKYINDTYGHAEGDFSICAIAESIKYATAQTKGISGRVGGDEFSVILFDSDIGKGKLFEALFFEKLALINQTAQKSYLMDASIGFYATILDENCSYEECMKHSDQNLYKNKRKKKRRQSS